MVKKKTKVPEIVRVDLACGSVKPEGWTGIDKFKCPGVDIVHDLEKTPWPLKDNSVDEVRCSHYVEHTEDLCKFLDELWRVLKVGGKAEIICPFARSDRAFQDPTHKRFMVEASMLYANRKWREDNKLGHYLCKCDFDFTYAYNMDATWATRNDEAKLFALKHYWNVANDIMYFLVKRP